MVQLKELYEELNYPSKTKLLQVAKRRGINTAGVDDVITEKPVQQLFGKAPAQKGHIATTGEHDKWQADLIDFKQYSKKNNEGHNHALVVTNVFDRKTYTLPIRSKEPKEVWAKFQAILGKFGAKPKRLDVDKDNAFAADFATRAQEQGIEMHVRSTNPPDVNFLGVNDAANGKLKQSLFKDNGGNGWKR